MLKKLLGAHRVALALSALSCWVGGCDTPVDSASKTQAALVDRSSQDAGGDNDAGTASCDDGNPCNGIESRDAQGVCHPGTPPTSDASCDGRDDDCDGRIDEDFAASCSGDASVACLNGALVTSSCSDGDSCTVDHCAAGVCVHAALSCDDENACTNDICFVGSCFHSAIHCDDGNVCTSDSCDPGLGCEAAPIAVDDGDGCTIDRCDPTSGISHQPASLGDSCGPSSFCDGGDQCVAFTACASNLIVAAGQNLVLNGPCAVDSLTFSGGTLTVNGSFKAPAITIPSGSLIVHGGALIAPSINLQSGSVDVEGDIAASVTVSGGTFTSGGMFDASASGFSQTGGTFINSGVLKLASFDASSVHGGSFINRGVLEIANNAITVPSGVSFSESGLLGQSDSIGSLRVDGVLTHDAGLASGLAFTVTGDAAVSVNGKIDLGGRGLAGGGTSTRPSQVQGLGYVWSAGQWVVAAVGGSDSAGSHGGVGSALSGASTSSNDAIIAPGLLGSGGGGLGGDNVGGNGGGRLDLIVNGTLTLDGTVSVNGSNSSYRFYSGGGAAGSLRLRVGTLAGATTGQLLARGGGSGAGAGGGRIAIEFDHNGFAGSMQANGGAQAISPGAVGGAGTIYLRDRAQANGDLIIDNGGGTAGSTSIATSDGVFRQVSVRGASNLSTSASASGQWIVSGGNLTLSDAADGGSFSVSSGSLTLTGPSTPSHLALFGTGTVTSNGSLTLTAANVLQMSGGTFVNAGAMAMPSFDATTIQAGTFINRGRLDIASDVLTVPSGVTVSESGSLGRDDSIGELTVLGTLLHDAKLEAGLSFTVRGDATVPVGGKIDVSRRGLAGYTGPNNEGAGQGYVLNGTQWVVTNGVGGTMVGGSHGGIGGATGGQTPAPINDVLDAPVLLGSGGGGSDIGNGDIGASGGGRVDLIVNGRFSLDGTLAADGGNAASHSGAGAGGTLRLRVGEFTGAGSMHANGGNGGGAGGGGRISVSYDAKSFSGTIQASATGSAGPGTLYDHDLSTDP